MRRATGIRALIPRLRGAFLFDAMWMKAAMMNQMGAPQASRANGSRQR